MRLEFGTPVRCSDGMFGELVDLVIEPTKRRVTHLVVQPQPLAGSRLVPVELTESAGDQSQITLHCTLHEVSELEPVEEVTHFVLEHGHPWGHRDVTIPINAVEKIETDRVTVGLTKHEVGELPAVRVHRW